jgi:hypothetical protein
MCPIRMPGYGPGMADEGNITPERPEES